MNHAHLRNQQGFPSLLTLRPLRSHVFPSRWPQGIRSVCQQGRPRPPGVKTPTDLLASMPSPPPVAANPTFRVQDASQTPVFLTGSAYKCAAAVCARRASIMSSVAASIACCQRATPKRFWYGSRRKA